MTDTCAIGRFIRIIQVLLDCVGVTQIAGLTDHDKVTNGRLLR